MVNTQIYSLFVLALLKFATAADDDTTTTVTTTPIEEQTTTVGLQEEVYGTEYIFTDSNGSLTTTTEFASTVTNPYTLSADNTSSEEPTQETQAPSPTSAPSTSSTSAGEEEEDSSSVVTNVLNPYYTEIRIDVPPGVYSTSTLYSQTTLDGGKTAVLELLVLHTAVC